jgi:hypothetical protein
MHQQRLYCIAARTGGNLTGTADRHYTIPANMIARFAHREWHEEQARMNIRNREMEKSKRNSKK